jgi:hypothetical protein
MICSSRHTSPDRAAPDIEGEAKNTKNYCAIIPKNHKIHTPGTAFSLYRNLQKKTQLVWPPFSWKSLAPAQPNNFSLFSYMATTTTATSTAHIEREEQLLKGFLSRESGNNKPTNIARCLGRIWAVGEMKDRLKRRAKTTVAVPDDGEAEDDGSTADDESEDGVMADDDSEIVGCGMIDGRESLGKRVVGVISGQLIVLVH